MKGGRGINRMGRGITRSVDGGLAGLTGLTDKRGESKGSSNAMVIITQQQQK